MRLLFDQNLSPRLARSLADVFPGSMHVQDVGLSTVGDGEVWDYAKAHGGDFKSPGLTRQVAKASSREWIGVGDSGI